MILGLDKGAMRSTLACMFDAKGGTIMHIDFNRHWNNGTNAMAAQAVVMISVPISAKSQLIVVNMSPRECWLRRSVRRSALG
jgi:hypothetical protein